jgi:hypothetical protein
MLAYKYTLKEELASALLQLSDSLQTCLLNQHLWETFCLAASSASIVKNGSKMSWWEAQE